MPGSWSPRRSTCAPCSSGAAECAGRWSSAPRASRRRAGGCCTRSPRGCPGAPIAVLSGPTFAHEVAAGPADRGDARRARTGARGSGCATESRSRPSAFISTMSSARRSAARSRTCWRSPAAWSRARPRPERARRTDRRGYAEMMRFGVACGAGRETLAGLCGLGDLVLTCSSTSSAISRSARAGRRPLGRRAARRPPHRGRRRVHRAGADSPRARERHRDADRQRGRRADRRAR